jgi:uncharacterized protein (TIGR03067 family)
MIKISLLIVVLFCALSCGIVRDKTKSTDHTNIQGVWLGQTESQNGILKNVTYLYDFKGDELTFTDENGKEMKYSFRLDTAVYPRLIIIQSKDSLIISAPVSVAYELHGDSLKIVVAPEGLHPTEISDKNNQELISCKRKGK